MYYGNVFKCPFLSGLRCYVISRFSPLSLSSYKVETLNVPIDMVHFIFKFLAQLNVGNQILKEGSKGWS